MATDINKKLYYAAQHGNLDEIKIWVDRGAELDSGILNAAIDANNIEIVKFYLSKSINFNYNYTYDAAIRNGNLNIIKCLLNTLGKRFFIENIQSTADGAIKYGHIELLKYFVEHCNAKLSYLPLMKERRIDKKYIEIIKYFIEKNINLNGYIFLNHMIRFGTLEILECILENFKINIEWGNPVNTAAKRGNVKIFKYITQKYPIPITLNILEAAIRSCNIKLVQYIMAQNPELKLSHIIWHNPNNDDNEYNSDDSNCRCGHTHIDGIDIDCEFEDFHKLRRFIKNVLTAEGIINLESLGLAKEEYNGSDSDDSRSSDYF